MVLISSVFRCMSTWKVWSRMTRVTARVSEGRRVREPREPASAPDPSTEGSPLTVRENPSAAYV